MMGGGRGGRGKGGGGGGGKGGKKGFGGRAPPGGGGRGRGRGGCSEEGGPTGRQAACWEEVVYSTFPLAKTYQFAEDGPHSFRQLSENAEDAGCHVQLRHRAMVIRGARCREVYQDFLDAACALGADLTRALSSNGLFEI